MSHRWVWLPNCIINKILCFGRPDSREVSAYVIESPNPGSFSPRLRVHILDFKFVIVRYGSFNLSQRNLTDVSDSPSL